MIRRLFQPDSMYGTYGTYCLLAITTKYKRDMPVAKGITDLSSIGFFKSETKGLDIDTAVHRLDDQYVICRSRYR